MTVSRSRGWKPETLGLHGIAWQLAAAKIMRELTPVTAAAADAGDYWVGGSGDTARERVATIHTDTIKVADALNTAATAATTGALDISAHRQTVLKHVDDALANTFDVADDGTVSASKKMYTTLVARLGAAMSMKAWGMLISDAADRTITVQKALADLRTADQRCESAIREAFSDKVFAANAVDPSKVNLGQIPALDASVETNRHWWNTLTEAEQAQFISTYPDLIGNRDGIPIADRDAANRVRLPGMIALAEAEQSTVAAQFGTDSDEYRAATTKLDDLKAVDKAITKPTEVPPGWVDRKLILLDTTAGRQTRAAVSVGDPDKAEHVAVVTPGLDTRVRDDITGMTSEADLLNTESKRQLALAGRGTEDVATVAWIGYDTPQVKKVYAEGEYGAALEGLTDVGSNERAAEGGQALNRFYNGLEASHQGTEPPHITAVGHSYGSLTTGMALQDGDHPVTDMVVYGSPGVAAASPGELGLEDGHAYVMRTDDDPIKWAQDGPKIAGSFNDSPVDLGPFNPRVLQGGGVPVLADVWGASDNGGFGPDPATNSNFNQLETGQSLSEDGEKRPLFGAFGHSDYPRAAGTDAEGNPIPRVTTYNIAAVVAGLPDNAIGKR
ncbi:alpha/beta hydrolase [Nocardia sp. NPDC058480]|uniref:alpha/beta hydrolase n=1 Tax=Nocardia sp. NPDC058480 TaxID=3346522 RepID=UPI00365CCE18